MFKGKKILVGITGSIAAYKSVFLVRLLAKEGAEVKVILTPAALQFVTPLTLSTLSKNSVLTDLSENDSWQNHALLGRWADIMIIAPASCNTLSKMASGLCDNLLLAVYLSATCPVLVAPAMDEDMWMHPSTRANLLTIQSFGNQVLPVNTGELASGLNGAGRMAEPEEIVTFLQNYFLGMHALNGESVLITAGPTQEAIDPVRFIGNHSSGKMGIALAETCYNMGANVTMVMGPSNAEVLPGINLVKVTSAKEMYNACLQYLPDASIIILAAAVADYTPEVVSPAKIKKSETELVLRLVQTDDILLKAGQLKKENQLLVGFALETNNESFNARKKLAQKNADLIVLNSLNGQNAVFGADTNKITIFDKRGGEHAFDLKSKKEVARDIVNSIIAYKNA